MTEEAKLWSKLEDCGASLAMVGPRRQKGAKEHEEVLTGKKGKK